MTLSILRPKTWYRSVAALGKGDRAGPSVRVCLTSARTSDVLFIEIEKSKDQMSILEAEKCPFYGFEMRFGPSNVDFSSDLVLR